MDGIKRTKFNVSLLGESEVGKTSMVQVRTGTPFNEDQLATVGVENFIDTAIFEGKEYKFKIFDTAGQERYNSVATSVYKAVDGYLLVFAVDKKKTLEKISNWINSLEENVNLKEKVLILVGNKCDKEKREVSKEDGIEYAKSFNIKYFETSAKTRDGIDEVFHQIYQDLYELNEEKGLVDKKKSKKSKDKKKEKEKEKEIKEKEKEKEKKENNSDNNGKKIELNKEEHIKIDKKERKRRRC